MRSKGSPSNRPPSNSQKPRSAKNSLKASPLAKVEEGRGSLKKLKDFMNNSGENLNKIKNSPKNFKKIRKSLPQAFKRLSSGSVGSSQKRKNEVEEEEEVPKMNSNNKKRKTISQESVSSPLKKTSKLNLLNVINKTNIPKKTKTTKKYNKNNQSKSDSKIIAKRKTRTDTKNKKIKKTLTKKSLIKTKTTTPKNQHKQQQPSLSSHSLASSSSSSLSPWLHHMNQYHIHDSKEMGKNIFDLFINPVTSEKFFRDIWEKKPLLVRRHNQNYYNKLFSIEQFSQILKKNKLNFTENIDIVTYLNDKRETHNPDGRAFCSMVWDFYKQGCSVRMLNPQTYHKPIWSLLSLLQEHFNCMAGANVYLTPPGTQGFAPHWDDIEAFIIQLEGKKQWKVYEPLDEENFLPRFSSPNFSSSDLQAPVLDITLETGDMLYFPRGFIHQASTPVDSHSLHLTVSVNQKNTWGDLFQILLPRTLELATEECLEFRESLPIDYLDYMGVVHSDDINDKRLEFKSKLSNLFSQLINFSPIDSSVDQMSKNFLHSSLPPCLTSGEKECSVRGETRGWKNNTQEKKGSGKKKKKEEEEEEEDGKLHNLELDTEVRIIRKGCLRLVTEETVSIYHNLENSRVFQSSTSLPIEVTAEEAEMVEYLIKQYPFYVTIDNLPSEDNDAKLDLAQVLYDRSILMTKVPLCEVENEEEEEEEEEEDDGRKDE